MFLLHDIFRKSVNVKRCFITWKAKNQQIKKGFSKYELWTFYNLLKIERCAMKKVMARLVKLNDFAFQ